MSPTSSDTPSQPDPEILDAEMSTRQALPGAVPSLRPATAPDVRRVLRLSFQYAAQQSAHELKQRAVSDWYGLRSWSGQLQTWLARLLRSPLARTYRWVLIPLLVVGAVQLNAHIYYNTFFGYDMPLHFNNLYAVVTTGTFPPPPEHPGTFFEYSEAPQAPAFYILTAWVVLLGRSFVRDSYSSYVPVALLLVSLLNFFVLCYLIQTILRRVSPWLRALCACVLGLLPCGVISGAMYNNDFWTTVSATITVVTLWLMARSGRFTDQTLWLRAAIFTGFSILFKTSGFSIAAIYGAWAGCILLGYVYRCHWAAARRLIKVAAIGIPLMLIPLAVNLYHGSRYSTQPFGVGGGYLPPDGGWGASPISFLTNFDTQVFYQPLGLSAVGSQSFWSRLYITLFSDPYDFWYPNATDKFAIRPERMATALGIVGWAVPVALLIAIGFFNAFYRSIRYPRQAMHDGNLFLLITTVIVVVSILAVLAHFQNQVFIQSRYIMYLYPLLFLNGLLWVWRLFRQRYSLVIPSAKFILWFSLAVYCVAALRFLWLAPS